MEIKEMNIYEKVQNCRVMMQDEGIKKMGKNTFAKYDYYKLSDLNTVMNRALKENRLCTHFQVTEQIAMLTIYNIDNPSEELFFSMPFVDAEMSKVTPIQNWGASISYLQRYLILEAFQIGECEVEVDSSEQSENRANENKPSSIKEEVQTLCREKSKDHRAEVNNIIKKYNNGSISISKVENEEALKNIKEEVEVL
jgi:ERF superfamily